MVGSGLLFPTSAPIFSYILGGEAAEEVGVRDGTAADVVDEMEGDGGIPLDPLEMAVGGIVFEKVEFHMECRDG